MAQKKGLAKGVAISAAGGAAAGAGTYAVSKEVLKSHETKNILLSDDNVNPEVFLKAMKEQWKDEIAAAPADANLDSERGTANLIEYLYNENKFAELNELLAQKRLLCKINMGDVSFSEFVKQQGLQHFIPESLITPDFRFSTAYQIHGAIYSKYNVSLIETNFRTDSERVAEGIYNGHLNASQIENLINSADLSNAWRGNYNANTDFDYLLNSRFSPEELASMSVSQKCDLVMQNVSGNITLSKHGGFTGQSVVDYMNTLTGTDEQNIEDLSTAINFYRTYVYAKNYKEGVHYNLDFQDTIDLLGDTTQIQNQTTQYINLQRDTLETAIEHKCGLPEDTVGLDGSNVLVENQVSEPLKEEFSRNIFDCESYIKYLREPIDNNMTGTQQIEALGIRDQIDAMIASGEVVGVEDITQPIADATAIKFGGIGSAAVFAALLARYYLTSRKIKKQCAANPEAAEAYNNYMVKKQAEEINKKMAKQQAKIDKKQAKLAKKNAKRNRIQDICDDAEENESVKKR